MLWLPACPEGLAGPSRRKAGKGTLALLSRDCWQDGREPGEAPATAGVALLRHVVPWQAGTARTWGLCWWLPAHGIIKDVEWAQSSQ